MNTVTIGEDLSEFTPEEQAYICSPKTLDRLSKATYKGLGLINIIFDSAYSGNSIRAIGKSNITFHATSNMTAKESYMGLTPWILVHRLFHGFESDLDAVKNFESIDNFISELWDLTVSKEPPVTSSQIIPDKGMVYVYTRTVREKDLNLVDLPSGEVGQIVYGLSPYNTHTFITRIDYGDKQASRNRAHTCWASRPKNIVGCWRITTDFYGNWPDTLFDVLVKISTFRSARTGKLLVGEWFPEIWAQYCVLGELRFNQTGIAEIDALITKYKPLIEAGFAKQVDYIKGKVVVF